VDGGVQSVTNTSRNLREYNIGEKCTNCTYKSHIISRKLSIHTTAERQYQTTVTISTSSLTITYSTDQSIDQSINESMNKSIDRWMDRSIDGWMDGWIDGWMD